MSNPTSVTAPTPGGTASQFLTTSTDAIKKSIRRVLLDYAEVNGANARDVLDERLFIDKADDLSKWPYAVMRIEFTNDGRFHGMQREGALEIQVHGRPWSMRDQIERVGDLFDRCLLSRLMRRDGLTFAHGFQRVILPAGGGAVDSEVCTLLLSYSLTIYPAYLTSMTTHAP